MNILLVKGILAILFGSIITLVSGYDLFSYYSGDAVEFISSRFGTITGMSAISFHAAYFIVGVVFITWGVYFVKRGNKST